MGIFAILLTIIGLIFFETISSIDNAVINAQVLSTMGQKARQWFLWWGLLIAVFLIRGLFPWLLVWLASPRLGPLGALTGALNNDPAVVHAVAAASPLLLVGGGIFLILLFFSWLFLEEKEYGLIGERFFHRQGSRFTVIVLLSLVALFLLAFGQNLFMALAVVVGSGIFFLTHWFRINAERQEEKLLGKKVASTDTSKILFLMIIDTTFSLDGVLGAFAFTLSVPLIFIGMGIGALIVRQLTVRNVGRIQQYIYLKNGAMYSMGALGLLMVLESFGFQIPNWISPIVTFVIVGYFFLKSKRVVV